MLRGAINAAIHRVRDRRTRLRQRLEDVFDRQTFVTLLFLGPVGKSIELLLLGRSTGAAKFAALAGLGLAIAIYWERVASAAESAGDKLEEATEEGE